ncbi:MAG: type II secretion system protein J [Planctomycetota bacterium]
MTGLGSRPARARRFSLLEVLVAMSILVVLGTALMVILRGGLNTWRRSEARRESYDMAQSILLQLRDDFGSMLGPVESPLPGLGETEARLLCVPEADGRTTLFLVRSLKAENEHPITGHAGSVIGADAVIDQRDDLAEARAARLRATGGAAEVAWVLGPDNVLYRGVRTPIGPPLSLFAEGGYELAPPLPEMPTAGAEPQAPSPSPSPSAEPGVLRPALLRPFARNVIYFECLFRSQYTRTWSTRYPALREPRDKEVPGPLDYWDSTRALVSFQGADDREFHTFLGADSLTDPRDDIFPSAVQVTVVLEEANFAGSSTFLTAPVGAQDTEILVQDPNRIYERSPDGSPRLGYVRIGDEWIEFDEVRGRALHVTKRGARRTTPADHDLSDEVFAGQSFTVVLECPAWREDLSDGRPVGGQSR